MKLKYEYFIFANKKDKDACFLDYLIASDSYNLRKALQKVEVGMEAENLYPANVHTKIARGYTGYIPDMIPGFTDFAITGKLKVLLGQNVNVEIEFLPFKLYTNRYRNFKGDYFIFNVIGSCDCIDNERTQGKYIDKYDAINQLYLDLTRIPSDRNLFRLNAHPTVLIIRSDLRKQLENNGITGIRYIAMGEIH